MNSAMEGGFFTRHRRTLISAGVVLVVALHIVPLLYPRERFWPIMQWSMYRNSSAPGPVFTRIRKVFATTKSGKVEAITPGYTGLSIFVLERDYFRPWSKGDSTAPSRLLEMLNAQRREDPFVDVRLEVTKYTITDSGIVTEQSPPTTFQPEAWDSDQ
jgi:hypothetical protein